MATQKVWHEELQDWVYEDPDIPENLDFEDCNIIDISKCDFSRAMLPLNILEGRPLHAKKNN